MDLVFVHLNSKVPSYLRFNLQRHIQLFPDRRVVLIQDNLSVPYHTRGLTNYQVQRDHKWEELDMWYKHSKQFRKNFWLTSSARLFAIDSYMKDIGTELIHIESDVVISIDFPFERLARMKQNLAFPVMSEERGVGSVIYVRNRFSSEALVENLINEAKKYPMTTEMLSLRKTFNKYQTQIIALSIGPNEKAAYRNITNETKENLIASANLFQGIFDGVEIGQYFFGTDPRNRRGRILMRNDLANGYCDVSKWKLRYDEKRNFPNLIFSRNGENVEFPIFALHLPSKELRLFNLNYQRQVIRKRCRQSNRGTAIRFSVRVFTLAIFNSLTRRFKEATNYV